MGYIATRNVIKNTISDITEVDGDFDKTKNLFVLWKM